LNTLLVMMKGIPLAYDKDMQEDKEAIFDAVDTLELCLRTVTPMLATMTPLPANMRRAAAKGFINATDCADYLTKKGMPFRDAYTVTGHLVAQCTARGKTLEELTLEELKAVSELFEADVYDALTSERCYKAAFDHETALNMIVNGECGAFNPLLLECLMDGADQIKQAMQETEEEKQKDAEQSQRQEANRLSREVLQEEGLLAGREKQGSARKHRENAPKTSE
jgi:hypothetical protein